MKKNMLLLIAVLFFLGTLPVHGTFAETKVSFVIDEKPFQAPAGEPEPYINKDNRTMVPVRFVSHALGVPDENIKWNEATRTAIITKGEHTVQITVGQTQVIVNGKAVKMDTKAEVKGNRLFIPIRYIAEGLGASLVWHAPTNTVYVYSPNGDEVFEDPDLLERMNAKEFEVKDGKLIIKDPFHNTYDSYVLSEKYIPNLNERVYEAVKQLYDKNHYVNVVYVKSSDVGDRLILGLAKGKAFALNGFYYFQFVIYDNRTFDVNKNWLTTGFSDKANISLTLNSLWDDLKDGWVVPFYENKLRVALKALLGQEQGENVSDYIINHYLQKRTKGKEAYYNVRESKQFGNIQVDFANDDGSALYFDFTIREK